MRYGPKKNPVFDELATRCQPLGLQVRDCGNGHWQIRGGPNIVNYYPGKGSIFINGMRHGIKNHWFTMAEAIEAASTPPQLQEQPAPPRRSQNAMRRIRRRLWAACNKCTWCGVVLEFNQSTIDHRIPRARGGSDLPDNLVLACKPCNTKRGHNMPELHTAEVH